MEHAYVAILSEDGTEVIAAGLEVSHFCRKESAGAPTMVVVKEFVSKEVYKAKLYPVERMVWMCDEEGKAHCV